jgi:hypothetical protein
MDRVEIAKETIEGATMAKTAPVAAGGTVSVLSIAGVGLPDIVYVLTALSLVVSIAYKLWAWRKEVIHEDRSQETEE